jgi:hypothetical protein
VGVSVLEGAVPITGAQAASASPAAHRASPASGSILTLLRIKLGIIGWLLSHAYGGDSPCWRTPVQCILESDTPPQHVRILVSVSVVLSPPVKRDSHPS